MLFLWSHKCALHAGSIESRKKVNSCSSSQYAKDQEYVKIFSLKVKKKRVFLPNSPEEYIWIIASSDFFEWVKPEYRCIVSFIIYIFVSFNS